DCSVYNDGAHLSVTMDPPIIDKYTHRLKFNTTQELGPNKVVTLSHSLIYQVTVRNDSNLDNPYVVNNLVTNRVLNLGDPAVNQIDFVALNGINSGNGFINIRILVHLFDFLEDDPLKNCALFEQSIEL
ncbi:28786_t:CDS:1, partial [Gigaspora margarita]